MNSHQPERFDAGFDRLLCGDPVRFHYTFLGDKQDETQLDDYSNWTILFECACPYRVLVCDAGRDSARIPHFEIDWHRYVEKMKQAGARKLMVAQGEDGPLDAPYYPPR